MGRWIGSFIAVLAVIVVAGCATNKRTTGEATAPVVTPAPAPAEAMTSPTVAPEPATTPTPAKAFEPVRIKAGGFEPFTDAQGNKWLPDQGFADGETVERPDIEIANTETPAIYRSERYAMTAFSYPVPNGKYTVKLHFCETYEGIYGPGERVFSFNVEGHEFRDFDVWVKAGGPLRAYIETVNVDVTDGKLDITFAFNIENPEINGIEILPAS